MKAGYWWKVFHAVVCGIREQWRMRVHGSSLTMDLHMMPDGSMAQSCAHCGVFQQFHYLEGYWEQRRMNAQK